MQTQTQIDTQAVKHHPAAVDLELIKRLAGATPCTTLVAFLSKEFDCVSRDYAGELMAAAEEGGGRGGQVGGGGYAGPCCAATVVGTPRWSARRPCLPGLPSARAALARLACVQPLCTGHDVEAANIASPPAEKISLEMRCDPHTSPAELTPKQVRTYICTASTLHCSILHCSTVHHITITLRSLYTGSRRPSHASLRRAHASCCVHLVCCCSPAEGSAIQSSHPP